MELEELATVKIVADQEKLDDDKFISLWNVAASTMGGDYNQTRMLASKLLGFLCKKRCPFIVISPSDASYLDTFFERDNSLLHDWSAESEKVDILAQHANVPFEILKNFLQANKFNPTVNHNPRRADREAWFSNDWAVG